MSFIFLYSAAQKPFDKELLFKTISDSLPNVKCLLVDAQDKEAQTAEISHVDMIALMPSLGSHLPFFFNKYPNTKWIHSLAAGVEPLFALKEIQDPNTDIILTNSKGAYSVALGEFALLSFLHFNYHIPKYLNAFTTKDWISPTTKVIQKKTLTIFGYGKNGVAIAQRAKAFEMKIIGIVREIRDSIEGKELCDEIIDFPNWKSVIGKSDFIVATLPHVKDSIGFFNLEFFKMMKPSAVFINIGRGSAVIEDDIVNALNNNIIRGAALDVTRVEPLEKDSKIYQLSQEKLLLTCHSVDHTDDLRQLCYDQIVNTIKIYFNTGKPGFIVDRSKQY